MLSAGPKVCSPSLSLALLIRCRLNLIFIIGSVSTNLSALLVGSVLDRYGPFPCAVISCTVLFLGSLCMSFAHALPFDGYAIGYLLLALGGTFTFVPSFHLSNAFPQLQGLILSLITGAFDASAAVFLAFRLIYQSTDGSFSVAQFFRLYLVVPILMLLAALFLMPKQSYETRAELETAMERVADHTLDVHDSDEDLESTAEVYRVRSKRAAERAKDTAQIEDLIGDQNQQVRHDIQEDEKKIASGVWGVLHGVPATQQMASPWFILICLFTVLQMTRFNFFISTIWTQYEYLLDSAKEATELNQFFDLVLPIGGVVTVPFIGLLLDKTSTVTVLALLVLLSTVIGVLGAIPSATAGYLNVILFCIFRPLYYSAMSDYAAKVFGFATFGTVYGTMICVSGLTIFSQPALQALVHDAFYEDPGPINLYLAGTGLIIGVALVMYVDTKARVIRQNQFTFLVANAGTMDPDDERRSLLSVSLYDGRPGTTPRRRRVDLTSPRLRAQDAYGGAMAAGSIPNLNASLFYNYGSFGANLPPTSDAGGGGGADDDVTPVGSLRVRRSRQALGAGLRTVTERDEPADEEVGPVTRKIRAWQERTSQTIQRSTEEATTTPSASEVEGDDDTDADTGVEADVEDEGLSQLISLDDDEVRRLSTESPSRARGR